MKIRLLLDENLPRPLKDKFSVDFDVTTVPDKGWASLKNGLLLAAMTKDGIEYLVTVDKNLPFQQNLGKYKVKVIVLRTYDNRYKTLKDFIGRIEQAIIDMPADLMVLEIDLREE